MSSIQETTSTETPAQVIDARSACADFSAHLKAQGLAPLGYAKDNDYRQHGFDFIQTESDIEAFLTSLESTPVWHHMDNQSCTKAWRIRNSLSKPDDLNWGKLRLFKFYASIARRTCCSCHETGSFKPN